MINAEGYEIIFNDLSKLIDIEYMMMCLRIYPNLKLAWYAALFEKKKEGGPCDHLTLS